RSQNLRGVYGRLSRIRPVGVSCLFLYDMDVPGAGAEQLGSLFHLCKAAALAAAVTSPCSTPIFMP
ncbi:MAG: hypothetical protein DBX46_05270, partial [Clostridiales bacterium]